METVTIVHKVKDPVTKATVESGTPQKVKRGKHGRFTSYVTGEMWASGIVQVLMGVLTLLIGWALGFLMGMRHITQIIAPIQ